MPIWASPTERNGGNNKQYDNREAYTQHYRYTASFGGKLVCPAA